MKFGVHSGLVVFLQEISCMPVSDIGVKFSRAAGRADCEGTGAGAGLYGGGAPWGAAGTGVAGAAGTAGAAEPAGLAGCS